MISRLNRAIQKLKHEGLDALLISSKFNIRYLTGYPGEDAYLLISRKEKPVYFTDFRYLGEMKKALPDQFSIVDIANNFAKTIANTINKTSIKELGFEGRNLPFSEFNLIEKYLIKRKMSPAADFIEEFRQIKGQREIEAIKKATKITVNAMAYLSKIRLVGKSEKAIADLLESRIRNYGAKSSSFEIIVAAGKHSSFPHAKSSNTMIKRNSIVLVDMGANFSGYNCDLTRVIFSGRIATSIQKIYRMVQEAKSLAINKIRPGIPISQIDKTARDYIAKKGYGKYFGHALGHGVGLEVHELPGISSRNNSLLKEGMVFTIEPAVYLPGKFGIRLEDLVLVTKDGVEVLNGDLFD